MTGKIRPFRGDEGSAIDKRPVSGRVRIGPLGIEGDEQADPVHHGGPDKAIHHYPFDNYPFWVDEIGDHPLLAAPGGFGENISTTRLGEDEMLIGDKLRLGTALVEISQGRQPCWKIEHRFGHKGMMAWIIETGRCGWYYRVLEPGTVEEGDPITLVERGHEGWTVAWALRLAMLGDAKHDRNWLEAMVDLPALAEPWKARARKRLGR
ncbi:MAG: MOSC domain-containing protein [Sphingomonadales bacterium]|nr:MOSC domain-containing protein [Sphingomonadales bacterium]MBD3774881.1 MOSC domain-containing protein [Paracoccaceae bacterium]